MDVPLERLVWIVRALAQPASVQQELYPPFTFPEDELVVEFEQCFDRTSSRYTDEWTGAQFLSLCTLDDALAKLDDITGPEDDELDHPHWTEIRRRATEVLRAFGWAAEEPPPHCFW